MFLETYPKLESWPHKRELNVVKPDNRQVNFTYLYIGKHSAAELFLHSSFKSGQIIPSLFVAREVLDSVLSYNTELPDAIIVDLVLDKVEYHDFVKFLERRKIDKLVSILYNENKLGINDINFLKYNQLVDDVFNIQNKSLNFDKKISFLKKVKKQTIPLQISSSNKKDVINANFSGRSMFWKRVIDITITSLLLIAAFPLFLIIAIGIKLESRGPIFYNALRAGRGFRIFNFYKFRTMEVDADKKMGSVKHLNKYANTEKGVGFLKIYNDPRVTRFGKFLRKTSLDELPQLINVLKGDMSLVGNRPLPIYEASTLTTNEFVERFMAPAGITGLWQIKKKSKPNMTAEERIGLDISYARKHNFLYDIKIIAKTPGALFQNTNS